MSNSKRRREQKAASRVAGPSGVQNPSGNRKARRHPQKTEAK